MGRRTRRITDYNASPTGPASRVFSWWMGSQKTWIFSIVLLATIVVGIIAVFVLPDPTPAGADGTTTAAPPPASSAPASPAAPEPVCKAQGAKTLLPEEVVLASYKTQWIPVGSMARPHSGAAGPTRETPWPQCFSRSPEGALYAAATFAVSALPAMDQGKLRELFTARASHSGNFDMLLADLPAGSPPENRPVVQISGYLWNSYSPDRASLQIRYRSLTGASTATTYNLVWENNDWLLVVPGKGEVLNTDPTNRSFTPWGDS